MSRVNAMFSSQCALHQTPENKFVRTRVIASDSLISLIIREYEASDESYLNAENYSQIGKSDHV